VHLEESWHYILPAMVQVFQMPHIWQYHRSNLGDSHCIWIPAAADVQSAASIHLPVDAFKHRHNKGIHPVQEGEDCMLTKSLSLYSGTASTFDF